MGQPLPSETARRLSCKVLGRTVMSETLNLSLKLNIEPVEIEQQDGEVLTYTLRELSGKERDNYLTKMSSKMKFDAKGNPSGLKDYQGLHAMLLNLVLRDPHDTIISVKDLQEFPARVQNALFEKAQEMNGLGDLGEAEAKNE